jgi:hypothetical protein
MKDWSTFFQSSWIILAHLNVFKVSRISYKKLIMDFNGPISGQIGLFWVKRSNKVSIFLYKGRYRSHLQCLPHLLKNFIEGWFSKTFSFVHFLWKSFLIMVPGAFPPQILLNFTYFQLQSWSWMPLQATSFPLQPFWPRPWEDDPAHRVHHEWLQTPKGFF